MSAAIFKVGPMPDSDVVQAVETLTRRLIETAVKESIGPAIALDSLISAYMNVAQLTGYSVAEVQAGLMRSHDLAPEMWAQTAATDSAQQPAPPTPPLH